MIRRPIVLVTRRLLAARSSPKFLAVSGNRETTSPWVERLDPAGSGRKYYWNKNTNETTHLGAPKPIHWVEVQDPQGSPLTYWWDPETNSTTALGEAKPSIYREITAHSPSQGLTSYQPATPPAPYNPRLAGDQPVSLGQSMKSYFLWGVGMSLAFGVVGALLR
eukprot:gene24352-29436_t